MARNIIKKGIKPFNGRRNKNFPFNHTSNKVKETTVKEVKNEEKPIEKVEVETKNKEKENIQEVMDTNEKIALANTVLSNMSGVKAKRIKKEKGLIERTENSAIILTEDNKELLKD